MAPALAPAPTPGVNSDGSSFRLECILDCIVSCRPNIIVSGFSADARPEVERTIEDAHATVLLPMFYYRLRYLADL